jgi:arginine N-succinyltransferase
MIEGARNRTLIVELMPHYPVYVPLLPGEAQAAMGQVHEEGELPFSILSEEGFETDEYIDIFDGGPILRAHRNALRSFSASMRCRVSGASAGEGERYLVAVDDENSFRAVVATGLNHGSSEGVALGADVKRRLGVTDGDAVLCVKL